MIRFMQVKSKVKNTVTPGFYLALIVAIILEAKFIENYFYTIFPTIGILYFIFSSNPRDGVRRVLYSFRMSNMSARFKDSYHVKNIENIESLKGLAWWTQDPKVDLDSWDEDFIKDSDNGKS